MREDAPILVAGASGYVGTRLIPRLLSSGFRVRALARAVDTLRCRPWAADPAIELVQADVLDLESLEKAARGCRAAYYLVHSMIAQKTAYADADRRAAINMQRAAQASGLEQIVYLGGLGEVRHPRLSRHLASRHEVGDILRSGSVPVTILRAAMILGSGSASFEILRYLVERLPVMITPRWVHTPTQPIAIGSVIDYLIGCLEEPRVRGRTYDIGGPDILAYKDLIDIYAREAGLPARHVLPVPVLTPGLSAKWIHLITPVPAAIAVPLTEGLGIPTTCSENRIRELIPVKPIPCHQAIRTALDQILERQLETCRHMADNGQPPEWTVCGDAAYAGGSILTYAYKVAIPAPAERIWTLITGIGGPGGYFFADLLWRFRGLVDHLFGGRGISRDRRSRTDLLPRVGDALDFWRILIVEKPRRLLLRSEMKAPGQALLDLQIEPVSDKRSTLRLISSFKPRGLSGLFYAYALDPWHRLIFRGMLKAIARCAGATGHTTVWRCPPHPMARWRTGAACARHRP